MSHVYYSHRQGSRFGNGSLIRIWRELDAPVLGEKKLGRKEDYVAYLARDNGGKRKGQKVKETSSLEYTRTTHATVCQIKIDQTPRVRDFKEYYLIWEPCKNIFSNSICHDLTESTQVDRHRVERVLLGFYEHNSTWLWTAAAITIFLIIILWGEERDVCKT